MQATSTKGAGVVFGLFQALSSTGLLASLAGMKGGVWPMPIPPEARAAYLGIAYSGTQHFETSRRETLAMTENLALVRARRLGSLGDIPLTVISAGRPAIAAGRGISEADAKRMKVVGEEMHKEMAALSTRGKRIIAEESGHYVQVDQPAVVVDAIREVVEAARG
jgi:pimeloyl-ACP methyl ester carboxylesterase